MAAEEAQARIETQFSSHISSRDALRKRVTQKKSHRIVFDEGSEGKDAALKAFYSGHHKYKTYHKELRFQIGDQQKERNEAEEAARRERSPTFAGVSQRSLSRDRGPSRSRSSSGQRPPSAGVSGTAEEDKLVKLRSSRLSRVSQDLYSG